MNVNIVGSLLMLELEVIARMGNSSTLIMRKQITIIINILGQITNCPQRNARLPGKNDFWQAANQMASALLLIGQQWLEESHSKARKFFTTTQLSYF